MSGRLSTTELRPRNFQMFSLRQGLTKLPRLTQACDPPASASWLARSHSSSPRSVDRGFLLKLCRSAGLHEGHGEVVYRTNTFCLLFV